MSLKLLYIAFIVNLISFSSYGQDIALYQQYNGRYDFTFIGNGLNPEENSFMSTPVINTSSSAVLNLNPSDQIQNAYLYWAGCGPGDYEVKLNGQTITPDRIFNHHRTNGSLELDYFSTFTNITNLVQTTGNGTYTLSDLDLNEWISYYYQTRTNFGGWAIIIIYKNNNLPLNQINVYDGLQAVPTEISFTLNSLNVIDNQNSKIGFLAWEGDQNIAVNESLSINNNLISNPPLNPISNAFNGTNSFTNDANLHNMDLDVYDLQDNIHVGDTSADIRMTSGQDFVMINAIVTKLNSQLPDAVVAIDNITTECNSKAITVHYTVTNFEATAVLPADVPIAIYVNGTYIQSTQTQNQIEIDGSESGTVFLNLPADIVSPFDVQLVVDDDGNHHGTVAEIRENNNTFSQNTSLYISDALAILDELVSCNEGYTVGTFDFSAYENQIKQSPTDVVTFYPTALDLENGTNEITNLSNYVAPSTPMAIFVKVDNGNCFNTTSFLLKTKKCKPIVYNFISKNDDGINDTFRIKGLRDVFLNYRLQVYNRWGKLVWTGNNNSPEWNGVADQGIILNDKEITNGTYFYSLELHDDDYPTPLYGYLFLSE
ncbi:gliding motility-associated C-terminal domain-containing protein [Flavobacterium sp.]|uniref:T9SS type B sorting domain-containing protein n=1 Tax=Flavobacterium sp. TaxID=239 RepID=UPI00286BF534|nr:gliding motility-associated C-terminal domain-containing protein [Flavobacterium sp.]